MNELHVYIILFVVTVAFLNSKFSFQFNKTPSPTNNLLVVEHLAQYADKPKNYRSTPENYQSFGYGINGHIHGDDAILEYRFPLIDDRETSFTLRLHARNVSSVVSQYGVKSELLEISDAGFSLASGLNTSSLKLINQDGLYYNNPTDWGLDYNHVINISTELTVKIAHFIVSELQEKNMDSYVNRVKAALNFVQYIPYGVPDFDAGDYHYMGLAIPHESVAISYSDCDSKSTLFAGILLHMISADNIILVTCKMDGGGHMITGVSDLPFPGQKVSHGGKDYLLLETTVPQQLEIENTIKYTDIGVIPVKSI